MEGNGVKDSTFHRPPSPLWDQDRETFRLIPYETNLVIQNAFIAIVISFY